MTKKKIKDKPSPKLACPSSDPDCSNTLILETKKKWVKLETVLGDDI